MHFTAAALALLIQAPDTLGPTYDSPATQALVERAVVGAGTPPADLQDYQAEVHTSMHLALSPDSVGGGDLPAAVDELVSEVRWHRNGTLHQEVAGHRTRMLIPLPYTLATLAERPWIVPHLYGSELFTPFAAAARAVNPFGPRGPSLYRYTALDTVRIRVQDQLVTLVPVTVRPRLVPGEGGPLLVLGTFYLDAERGSVARARFGFTGRASDLPASLGQIETFVEVDNALWEGRYWLPFEQRRDVVFNSRVLGGAVGARVISRFVSYQFNTGWSGAGPRVQLAWRPRGDAFEGWRGEVGADAGEFSLQDFADLRLAAATATRPEGAPPALQLHYERGSHLFRYNRVEGPFLGIGGRLVPADPRGSSWQLYGTAGWAFAEATPRGELSATWGAEVAPAATDAAARWVASGTAYRRLRDIQPFRPTFDWEWIYSLPALFWGSDTRDYYDAAGAELYGTVRGGRWDARLGGRVERHDSVSVNTERFLFGTAQEFGPLARVATGTHAALEASAGYGLGPGAFGIGNSAILRVDTELGVADFDYRRVSALLSGRAGLGPLTAAARVDAGRVWGGAPPQKLFRFGSVEGLRGYESNEFGGSTAVLARSRLLLGIPPRSTRPLARLGAFLIPPLRPSLVLVGESGWTSVDPELRDELLALLARPTDGWRTSVGAGISFLEDAFTIERLVPVGADADQRDARWYVGLTYWY